MPYTIIIHINNAEPIVGEITDIPDAKDNLLVITNPRLRDGKDIPYLADNAMTMIWPVDKIHFIEILAGKEEEEIIGFVRE